MTTSDGFTTPLRVALWVAPLLATAGWLAQWFWRFQANTPGVRITVLMFTLGSVVGGVSALCAYYQLIRRPAAATGGAIALTVVNTLLLLMALLIFSGL